MQSREQCWGEGMRWWNGGREGCVGQACDDVMWVRTWVELNVTFNEALNNVED